MNANSKNKKIVVGIFAVMLIVGLVSMYAPVLFTPAPISPIEPSNQSAAISEQVPSSTDVAAPSNSSTPSLEGFSGLSEESKALDNLGN